MRTSPTGQEPGSPDCQLTLMPGTVLGPWWAGVPPQPAQIIPLWNTVMCPVLHTSGKEMFLLNSRLLRGDLKNTTYRERSVNDRSFCLERRSSSFANDLHFHWGPNRWGWQWYTGKCLTINSPGKRCVRVCVYYKFYWHKGCTAHNVQIAVTDTIVFIVNPIQPIKPHKKIFVSLF